MKYYTYIPSPLGPITVFCEDDALTGLYLPGHPGATPSCTSRCDDHPVLLRAKNWLGSYFAGNLPPEPDFPLSPQGTLFQQAVWKELLKTPYGHSTTYGAIAKALAVSLGKQKMSAQAVGQAVGRNPISIIVPCHRVLGAKGSLTGYAGGIEYKMKLLELEHIPYIN